MIITTKISKKDYIKLCLILSYKRPGGLIMLGLGIFFILISILIFLNITATPHGNTPWITGFYAVLFLALPPITIYYNANKNFLTNAQLQEPTICDFNEDRIIYTGETFSVEKTWDKIYKIVELKDWILLFQSRAVCTMISKKDLGTHLDEFKKLIRSKPTIPQKLK